jgi:hypothetical protein
VSQSRGSVHKERDAAFEVITAIHRNTAEKQVPRVLSPETPTFGAFAPTYLQYLKAKRHDSDQRNEKALRLHITPYFGSKRLADVRMEDGLEPISKLKCDTLPAPLGRNVATGLRHFQGFCILFEVDASDSKRVPHRKSNLR